MMRYDIEETAVYDKYVRWCGRTGSRGPSYPIGGLLIRRRDAAASRPVLAARIANPPQSGPTPFLTRTLINPFDPTSITRQPVK